MASQFLRVYTALRAHDEERLLAVEQEPRRGPVHRRSWFTTCFFCHKLQDRVREGVVFDTSPCCEFRQWVGQTETSPQGAWIVSGDENVFRGKGLAHQGLASWSALDAVVKLPISVADVNSRPILLRLTFTTKGTKLISYWQEPSESQVFGSTFFIDPIGKTQESYTCHSDRSCDHIISFFTDGTRRDANRVEWHDAEGILKLWADYEYEFDQFGNWTKRTVWVGSSELEGRKLYETDYRTLTYWNK